MLCEPIADWESIRYIKQKSDGFLIDTSPTPNRTTEDYFESYVRQKDELLAELNKQISKEAVRRSDISGVHDAKILPATTRYL